MRLALGIGVIILLSASIAHGQPRPDPDPLNRIRPGSPSRRCSCRVMDNNTTTYPFAFSGYFTNGDGTNTRPMVVPFETNITVSCNDVATLAWSLTSSAGIGDQITPQRCVLTDCASSASACAGTTMRFTGDAACFTFGGAGSWTTHPDFEDLYGVIPMTTTSTALGGYLPYLCSGEQKPRVLLDRGARPFCRQNTDCTNAGVSGGTCVTTNSDTFKQTKKLGGGAFLLGKALNANTRCCACPER